MQTLEISRTFALTNKGCRLCRFWEEYSGEQGNLKKESLGLVGHGWGKCSNSTNCLLAKASLDLDNVNAVHNTKNSYADTESGVIVSTVDTFECYNFSPKLD